MFAWATREKRLNSHSLLCHPATATIFLITLISPTRILNLKLQNQLPLCQEMLNVSGIGLFVLLGFGHWTTLFNQMSTAAQNHTEQHESWTKKEIAQNSMTLLHLESTGCIAEKREASPGDCSVNILYMWQAWFGEKRDWIVFSWLSKQVVWQLSMISKLPQAWRHTHWNSSH